jgi:hypothetical protein
MKKSLLFLFICLIFAMMAYSQAPYSTSFEEYSLGAFPVGSSPAAPANWTTWSGGIAGENGTIVNTFAATGSQSLKLSFPSPTSDVFYKVTGSGYTTGKYKISFKSYVPTGQKTYIGILQKSPGTNGSVGCGFYNNAASGAGGTNGLISIYAGGGLAYSTASIFNSWVKFDAYINLDNDWAQFYINGLLVYQGKWSLGHGAGVLSDGYANRLESVDMWGGWGTNYVDDFVFDTYTPGATFTWNGTVDNNWNNPLNWSTSLVPGANDNVVINATPGPDIFGPTALCKNLNFTSGAITIKNYGSLTVTGTLTNSNVNNLKIESTGTAATGSLLHSTAGVKATVNRYYAGGEWHLISSPISDATAGMYYGLWLQSYNTATNTYSFMTHSFTPLNVMQGYALYNTSTATAQYKGTLNQGSLSYPVLYIGTPSPTVTNFNLVGNPYSSSIDWLAASGWDKSKVANATYIHVNAATWASFVAGVGANGGTRYIAVGQGFFVEATAAGNLSMNNNVRGHNNTVTFFKSNPVGGDEGNTKVNNIVRLQASGNGFTDEAVVRILPEATVSFDGNYDARKLFGEVAEASQIYSVTGEDILSINSIPETQTVKLGFKADVDGVFMIEATEINDLPNVVLEDKETGSFTDLTKNSYTFNFVAGQNDGRFVLHFNPLSVNELNPSVANIFSSGANVYVDLKQNSGGTIYVYNMLGQLITSSSVTQGVNRINISTSGAYIVKLVSSGNTMAKKVIID